MTPVQKLTIKLSEMRTRLNVLAAVETLEEKEQNEIEDLRGKFGATESQLRAAITAEGSEEARANGLFEGSDSEGAEKKKLLAETRMVDYLGPVAGGVGLQGRAAELNEALGVGLSDRGGVLIPWDVLAGSATEKRALTTTTQIEGGIVQRPVLQRLFGAGVLDVLGVRLDSVPAGRAEWPLIANGVTPAQTVEGTAAADPVAVTFSKEVLKPKRLSGVYSFSHELSAQVPGLESALRMDLADAVRAKMSDRIINGDESTDPEDVSGFLENVSAATPVPGTESGFGDYASVAAQAVDGIHASSESEVSVLLGLDSYRHAASVYQASGSGESASEALRRKTSMLMASSYIPEKNNSDVQNGNILHGGVGFSRGDSVAAVWPAMELIRDPYSQASQGVVLTWVTLWSAACAFRAGAYSRATFKVG